MSAADEREPLLASRNQQDEATESSPLLANQDQPEEENDTQPTQQTSSRRPSTWVLWPPFKQTTAQSSRKWRWPSIIAGIILAILVVAVLLVGFLVPGAVKQYAEQAAVIEPTSLSVESITADGVRARIQASFRLDGSRVEDANARRIGRFATGIMRMLGTEETEVTVHLPDYGNSVLGAARVPPLAIDIVDGHRTDMDFTTDLIPGDAETIRKVANNWLEGKLDRIRVTGSATLRIKSGIFSLGAHNVAESMVFEASNIPSLPEYRIEQLEFHDFPWGHDGRRAVGANVTLGFFNEYPISLNIPPLGFEILVSNCRSSDPHISVAEAVTELIEVRSHANVSARALGIISKIPESLVRTCPDTKLSPLDYFMDSYLHGEDAQVLVRGRDIEGSDTPKWISSILKSITVPIDLPGRSFGDLIRDFSAENIDFKLPSPFADPNAPESSPRVSGTIHVLAALPEEMKLDLAVQSIKSHSNLFFEGKKMGELNQNRWQDANSTRIVGHNEVLLNITTSVVDVPLEITDEDVFGEVLRKMFFGKDDILLDVEAAVDIKVGTVLGDLAVKGVPAKGKIPVKRLPMDTLNALKPDVDELRILNTSETGATIQARVNFTNPTPYTASIPYFSAHIFTNGSMIGEAVAQNVTLGRGNNTNNYIQATWDPTSFGGEKARQVARGLLSEYLSGKNTTLELKTHKASFPNMPLLGEAFSNLNFSIPTPRLQLPGGDDGNKGTGLHFIRDATFHIFSSTATFTLASPLRYNTIYLEYINATALWNHTEPVGQIVTHETLVAPPGLSHTPKLPVKWSPGNVGYDKLKEALGGRLKLDAVANVTIRLGNWVEQIWYEGQGIGARISL